MDVLIVIYLVTIVVGLGLGAEADIRNGGILWLQVPLSVFATVPSFGIIFALFLCGITGPEIGARIGSIATMVFWWGIFLYRFWLAFSRPKTTWLL